MSASRGRYPLPQPSVHTAYGSLSALTANSSAYLSCSKEVRGALNPHAERVQCVLVVIRIFCLRQVPAHQPVARVSHISSMLPCTQGATCPDALVQSNTPSHPCPRTGHTAQPQSTDVPESCELYFPDKLRIKHVDSSCLPHGNCCHQGRVQAAREQHPQRRI